MEENELTLANATTVDDIKQCVAQRENITDDEYEQGLYIHIREGNTDIVKYLVEVCEVPMYPAGFHLVCLKGHIDLVDYFIARGEKLSQTDCYGETPLMYAITGDKLDVVVKLLALMTAEEINIKDDNEYNATFYAAFRGNIDIMNHLIINGASLSDVSYHGTTPIDIARRAGHQHIVDCLSQWGF